MRFHPFMLHVCIRTTLQVCLSHIVVDSTWIQSCVSTVALWSRSVHNSMHRVERQYNRISVSYSTTIVLQYSTTVVHYSIHSNTPHPRPHVELRVFAGVVGIAFGLAMVVGFDGIVLILHAIQDALLFDTHARRSFHARQEWQGSFGAGGRLCCVLLCVYNVDCVLLIVYIVVVEFWERRNIMYECVLMCM